MIHREIDKTQRQRGRADSDLIVSRARRDESWATGEGIGITALRSESRAHRFRGKQIVVEPGAPSGETAGHGGLLVLRTDDVFLENVPAVWIPSVGMERAVEDQIIATRAVESFPPLEPAIEQKIVLNDVIRGAIIEVDVPTMVAVPAGVPQDGGLIVIE